MKTNNRGKGFWGGLLGAGMALGMAFAAGFVYITGKDPYTISIFKDRTDKQEVIESKNTEQISDIANL